jgi:hypothetical protein
MLVTGLNEGTLTPLMDALEREFPGIHVYSLPRIDPEKRFRYQIDLGVKGTAEIIDTAFARLKAGVLELGGEISDQAGSDR